VTTTFEPPAERQEGRVPPRGTARAAATVGVGRQAPGASSPPSRPAPAPACLARAAALVRPGLDAAILGVSPRLQPLVRHHLDGGGKYVRATLALLSASACGAPEEIAVPGGVAIELIHNFSLLHDDIVDGDKERRHRPTAWAMFGTGNAIIAGDALSTLAVQVLLSRPDERRVEAARILADATQEMIFGQIDDMTMSTLTSVSVDDCLAMTRAKTGALLSCAAEIGAVLGGAAPATRDALASFGDHLGIAFQGVDDVLGIWGDPLVTGKPAGNDLLARKKSLPVAVAMSYGDPSAEELVRLLDGPLGPEEVSRATAVLESSGAREEVEALADLHLSAALDCLDRVAMPESVWADLVEVAEFVTARDR